MILRHSYRHSVLSNCQSPSIADIGIIALLDTFKVLFVLGVVSLICFFHVEK